MKIKKEEKGASLSPLFYLTFCLCRSKSGRLLVVHCCFLLLSSLRYQPHTDKRAKFTRENLTAP